MTRAAASLTLEGADNLSRGLARVADDVGDLSEPGNDAARGVLEAARQAAPVDTGELVSSIHAAAFPDYAEVSASAPHAPFVEYGVPSRNMAAQPFLSLALEAEESRVLDVYAAHVQGSLDRVEGI